MLIKMSNKDLAFWFPGDIQVVREHVRACYNEIKDLKKVIKAADYVLECYEQKAGGLTNSMKAYKDAKAKHERVG